MGGRKRYAGLVFTEHPGGRPFLPNKNALLMTSDNDKKPASGRARTDVAQWSALALLLSGVVLTYLSFFLGGRYEVADSVLYYVAQCLVYAGSVFGVGAYVRYNLRGACWSARSLARNKRFIRIFICTYIYAVTAFMEVC